MDLEAEHQNQEERTDPGTAGSAESSNEDSSPKTGSGTEPIQADSVGLDHDAEISQRAPPGGAAAEQHPEHKPPDSDVRIRTEPGTQGAVVDSNKGDSVVFEISSTEEDGALRLHLESPDIESTRPQEEEEEPDPAAPADFSYEEHTRLLQDLNEQRERAFQRSRQLQGKLLELLSRRGSEEAQVERPESEQQREYEQFMTLLTELKQQIHSEDQTAQQDQEQLRSQAQETLQKAEDRWRAFVSLKQDVAVSVLSRRLGKQAAQDHVEATLAAEQLLQDELIKLRLKHLTLRTRIHRLDAELSDGDQQRDPLQIQFERLQAERLELRKQREKQNEESLKMRKKSNSSLEVLSHIKEKLFWTQAEVQDKKGQLAELEATLTSQRGHLSRIKMFHKNLQRDTQRLKRRSGLLGNTVLLRDFEDTVDANDLLEEKLQRLKGRRAKAVFRSDRWKKKVETP
ncbi:coiled-coil domain-containing protein 96 [Notolabrus celidotus]|uniref:coiled-coil domain-containing protein 96 n=1 Tax=Notolabrus celidotus TaxID=1203425 RepID=UPI0014904CF6|nr:coiled-coil domain-containing protein 96 [Notolabrus celidotus]